MLLDECPDQDFVREKTWKDQHRKTLHITEQNHSRLHEQIEPLKAIRSISIRDQVLLLLLLLLVLLQARFSSPWAGSVEEETAFYRTVAVVGRLLREDIMLQVSPASNYWKH